MYYESYIDVGRTVQRVRSYHDMMNPVCKDPGTPHLHFEQFGQTNPRLNTTDEVLYTEASSNSLA
jgi:hypothetical protein